MRRVGAVSIGICFCVAMAGPPPTLLPQAPLLAHPPGALIVPLHNRVGTARLLHPASNARLTMDTGEPPLVYALPRRLSQRAATWPRAFRDGWVAGQKVARGYNGNAATGEPPDTWVNCPPTGDSRRAAAAMAARDAFIRGAIVSMRVAHGMAATGMITINAERGVLFEGFEQGLLHVLAPSRATCFSVMREDAAEHPPDEEGTAVLMEWPYQRTPEEPFRTYVAHFYPERDQPSVDLGEGGRARTPSEEGMAQVVAALSGSAEQREQARLNAIRDWFSLG